MFYDTVRVLGIIFSHPGLNAGRVKDSHVCFGTVNGLADGFRKVSRRFKNVLEIFQEILFETGDLGSVRYFFKAAEFPEMPGIMKEDQKKGVCRYGENTLDNERPKKSV